MATIFIFLHIVFIPLILLKIYNLEKTTQNSQNPSKQTKKIQKPSKHTKNIFPILICTYSSNNFYLWSLLFNVFRHKTKAIGFPYFINKSTDFFLLSLEYTFVLSSIISPLSGVSIISNNI